MKSFPKLRILCCGLFFLSLTASAQSDTSAATVNFKAAPTAQSADYKRNIIKMNLSSLAFNNYSFTYERLIARKASVLAGYRFMPNTTMGSLKLSDKVVSIADDETIKDDLDKIHSSNSAFTAEIRLYTGRKPGAKGFYFGLYGRQATFKADYLYEYTVQNKEYDVPIVAKANGIGGGLLMGAQFALAKKIMVDFYVLGAHYGKLNGNMNATADLSELTERQRQDMEDDLNEMFIVNGRPFLITEVSASGVKGKIDGPFAGVRGLGLNIGFSF